MTRRASLPGADELFRNTAEEPRPPVEKPELEPDPEPAGEAEAPVQQAPPVQQPQVPQPPKPPGDMTAHALASEGPWIQDVEDPNGRDAESPRGQVSTRPKHEEKVTFYCTPEELTRLERARLALRADHRLATDRGRIIRAALAEILEEFEGAGSDSQLIRRLRTKNKR